MFFRLHDGGEMNGKILLKRFHTSLFVVAAQAQYSPIWSMIATGLAGFTLA
jgi:hypothetical protein